MEQKKIVLCGANAYEKKYYFNKEFDKIPEFIDEQVFSLAKAQERNFQKWSILESVDWVYFPSLGSYEKEVAYLKEFYTDRLAWLDRELNKL